MDGNRRWAKGRGLPAMEGHRQGYETLKRIGDACLDRQIKILTVYAFSTENWKRTEEEVSFLMGLLEFALSKELDYFISREVRLRILGRREGLRPSLIELIEKAEASTKDFTRATFAICLNYGGRTELVDAVRAIAAEGMPPESIDEDTITKRLYWSNMPDPDLIIRTSGEERLSGFLLWQSAYSELYWCEKQWPDFDEAELDKALETFNQRQRRYGK